MAVSRVTVDSCNELNIVALSSWIPFIAQALFDLLSLDQGRTFKSLCAFVNDTNEP